MQELLILLLVFGGALVVGYLLISRVPPLLHTPLMSMTNAVSAITVVGALLLWSREPGWLFGMLGAVALLAAVFNVVGGFAVTERMLRMFRKRNRATPPSPSEQ
jgi:H+-translocating NAD(P) transhydrogenase subunit alpha